MKKELTNLQRKIRKLLLKNFIMMLIFLAITPLGVSAKINPDEEIHLKIQNGNIKEVLKEIESQCNFTFIYNDAYINVNQPISIDCSNKPLDELLDEILTARGIAYTFIDNHIVLTDASGRQQIIKVSGNVRDAETNEILPGVTIVEKGTSNGTITDMEGNFTLDVPETGTLQISYVGYSTQEIAVAGISGTLSISMKPEVVSLSEIVVIGYGTVKKSDLTGAVSSVSADDIRQNIGSGIDQALQGRTAGVTVTTNSGTPGASPTVRIRGMGTITNPNPFYVVDGMPVSAETVGALNPGDIESLEILKDASSAAIYGARAANGVVLITTKKARAGQSSITLDAYTGVQTIAKKYELVNGTEWVTLHNAMGDPWQDSSKVVNTDWQDQIFRKANVTNLQLAFLNGTEKTNYAIVGNYFKQDGIVKGSSYDRYSLRVNTSSAIKKWLTIGENISFAHAKQNLIPEQDEYTSVIIQALTIDPITPVYTPEGKPSGAVFNNIGNPVGAIERNHNVLKTDQMLGNAFIDIKPFSWLSLKTNIGVEIARYQNEQFIPEFVESATIQSSQTILSNGSYNISNMLLEEIATFQKVFLQQHDVQLMVGYTRQLSQYRMALSTTASVPENSDLWYISNGNYDPNVYRYEDIAGQLNPLSFPYRFGRQPTDATMVSYLARLIYSFRGRYDLTASVRRDGSSKFGPNNRWGNFPSFAAGWKVSEESFFPKNDVLNFVKLRVGWGMLGNQEIGDYASFTTVSSGMEYTLGPGGAQVMYEGGAPRSFANQDIKWESTEQLNIGLDANLIRYRLTFNFDYFIRKTKDMLAQVPVPGVAGIMDPPYANVGSVSNKGFEINLYYRNRESVLKYGFGGNLGAFKNEVLSLGEGEPINSAGFRAGYSISRTEVGHPIASFYGYKTDGYFQSQAELDSLNAIAREATGYTYDGRLKPGDIKMVDINGDHVISDADRTFIGNPHPKLTYGINIDLEYKGIDLGIFGQGVYGNDVYMATIYYLESGGGYWNMMTTMQDYWQKEGDQSATPKLGLSIQDKNMRMSDRYVKDGSFFRIKNVQLGYTLPSALTSRIGIEKFRIYVNGQNLISFHSYAGFDPEIGIGRSGGTADQRDVLDIGIDRGMYPLSRTITAGVNVNF
jgi:TonB-linked SusC/RagA family outer membrane protein